MKRVTIISSIGGFLATCSLTTIAVAATAPQAHRVDTLASISLYDESLNDFVYSSILKPKLINTTLHENYSKLKTNGTDLTNVIISSGNKHIHKLKGKPVLIKYDSIKAEIDQDPKFANKPRSVRMNEFDKRFADELLKANKDISTWITREGGAVSNQFDIELTPKKGHFEAVLYLSVPEHLSDFANEFMTDINTPDQVDAILKANPKKITDVRLFGAVAFASPQALQFYYLLTTGNDAALLEEPYHVTNLTKKIAGTKDASVIKNKYKYVGKTNTDGQYFTYKGKRYIVIMSPLIDQKDNKLQVQFDFYSEGNYIDSFNTRAVAQNFTSHTTRSVFLDVLPASTKGASAKFSTSEQRRIIKEAFDPKSTTGGKVIKIYENIKTWFGILRVALPELYDSTYAMTDTIGHFKTMNFNNKTVDLIIKTLKESPMLDLTDLLTVLDKLQVSDLNEAALMTASTKLLRKMYLIFGTQLALEELSHTLNPNGNSVK